MNNTDPPGANSRLANRLRGLLSELLTWTLAGEPMKAMIEVHGVRAELTLTRTEPPWNRSPDGVNYRTDDTNGEDGNADSGDTNGGDQGTPGEARALREMLGQSPHSRYSAGCALSILMLLADGTRRLTQSEVCERLRDGNQPWRGTVIRTTLAELVKAGLLDNVSRDDLGQGYWLTTRGLLALAHEQSQSRECGQSPADGVSNGGQP